MSKVAAADEREDCAVDAGTVVGVLLGRRAAILRAARARNTIVLGAVFVLAAGLARDYDGADLTREPWRLAVPFIISAALGLLLYVLARVRTESRPGFWIGYRSFLGVMWLMAPTALLYGVPWERMLSPVNAAGANLITLAVVSTWRVTLMTRVVSVTTGVGPVTAFFRVMAVVGTAACAVLAVMPKPVFYMMGGIHQTGADALVAGWAALAMTVSMLLMIFWVIGAAIYLQVRGRWTVQGVEGVQVSPGAFVVAIACLMPWLTALPRTQGEQRLRHDVEWLMNAGRIDEALDAMSARRRDAFPPQWDPPPKIGWDVGERPPVLDVVERVVARGTTGWVREAYIDKLERRFMWQWWGVSDDERPRLIRLLAAMPEGTALEQKHAEWMVRLGLEPATAPAAAERVGATTQGVSR
jgi:hypothetical protein